MRLFLKTFLRNFSHNRLYNTINILGLAIGLACFTFILLFILDELSYDKFNKDYKRIYRLEADITISGKNQQVAKSSFALGPAFKKEFPEVEEFVRFRSIDNSFLRYNDKQFYEEMLYYADSTVFNVFTYHFIKGTPQHALANKNSIVLTESLAKKYFGNEDPMFKIMNLGNRFNCKVMGVIEDVPSNSHLQFDALISLSSYGQIIGEKMLNDLNTIHFWALRLFTYIKLKENTSIESIHQKFPAFHDKYIAEISKKLNGTYLLLSTRLDKIYLFSDLDWDLPNGDFKTIYIFSIVAIFILLIASINYMNLATARSAHRAKEVGVRKVLGANKSNLARMLITESLLLSFIALLLAFMIVETLLTAFNTVFEKDLTFSISQNPEAFLILITVTAIIGFISGSYPALYLSSFRPVIVLKGVVNTGKKSGSLRKSLIVFQFTISIIMIVGTFIVQSQMNFIRKSNLGFKKENVLIVRSTDTSFKKEMQVFKNELLTNSNIYNVSTSNTSPGGNNYMDVFLVEGPEKMDEQLMSLMFVDYNFIDLMGMKIINGRNFDIKYKTDIDNGAIINWMTAKKLGWNEDALGKEIHRRSNGLEKFKVLGVVEDFNFSALYEPVGPIVFFLEKNPGDLISMRINSKNKEATIAYIEQLWTKLNTTEPFKYDYLEDILNNQYTSDEKLHKIISYFALLSIFISLMGLFGLSSFITEQFSKSIGIRKLLGASVKSIVYLLSADFLKLIIISFFVAAPNCMDRDGEMA